jgi:taurine dioxygenase
MSVAVEPTETESLGTEWSIGMSDELVSAQGLARLRESLRRHVVVRVIAEDPIDPAAISAIANELGDPPAYTSAGTSAVPGHEIIGDFSTRAKFDDGRSRTPGATESLHQDFGVMFRGFSSYSILHTRDVPPAAPMRWASAGSAYASLPGDLRERIGTLRCVHSSGPDRKEGPRRPLVLAHPETGRPVLHLPLRRDAVIENVAEAESETIMGTLWEAIETSPARYAHGLESNDLYVWDNVASFHDNPAFPRDADRVVWFLTIPCRTKPERYGGT